MKRCLAILSLLCIAPGFRDVAFVASLNTTAEAGGEDHGNLTLTIATDADDGTMGDTGAWTFYSAGEGADGDGYFGSNAGKNYWLFARFVLSSAIPNGVTVTNAILSMQGVAEFSWADGSDDLTVQATDSANAAAPTLISQRPSGDGGSTTLTSTSIAWNNVTWAEAGNNNSPQLATLIQELVTDNGGLASSAGIVLWVAGDETGQNGSQPAAELREHVSNNVMQLVIQW